MRKLVKEMDPLCYIYYMEFKTFVKNNVLSVGEALSREVNFVLTEPGYSARSDQNDAHVEYSVFGLKDIKDIVGVLGGVLRPRLYRRLFCSDLQFSLVR